MATDWEMGYSELAYSVSVAEDALVNTLIKNISVASNKPGEMVPVSCQIVSGSDNGKTTMCRKWTVHEWWLPNILTNKTDVFFIKDSGDRNCELRLKHNLDYEMRQSYSVVIQLKSVVNLIGKDEKTAKVRCNHYLFI